MMAADSSSLIAYFSGAAGSDIDTLQMALANKVLVLPSVVLTEVLSDPKLHVSVANLLLQLPILSITRGFWERAGVLRARLIAKGVKARLADSLIAQNCLDHGAGLITRDRDFRHFTRHAGLQTYPIG